MFEDRLEVRMKSSNTQKIIWLKLFLEIVLSIPDFEPPFPHRRNTRLYVNICTHESAVCEWNEKKTVSISEFDGLSWNNLLTLFYSTMWFFLCDYYMRFIVNPTLLYAKGILSKNIQRKGRDLIQSNDKSPYTVRKFVKPNHNINDTKKCDYTTVADRPKAPFTCADLHTVYKLYIKYYMYNLHPGVFLGMWTQLHICKS